MAPDVEVDEPVDEPVEAPKPVSGPKLRALPSAGAAADSLDLPYAEDGKKKTAAVAAPPAPTPVSVAPVSVEPLSVEPVAPAPVGPTKWERSHDDILPTKGGGKKFFSLSLRRG